MRIVNQNAILLEHSRDDPYGFIEDVARTCYKSEAKKTPDSALKMVQNLIKSSHLAMLEHEYVFFKVDSIALSMLISDYGMGNLKYINFDYPYVSASFRALLELYDNTKSKMDFAFEVAGELFYQLCQKYPDIFPQIPEPKTRFKIELLSREEILEKYKGRSASLIIPHTIRFTTSRAVANELVRHRTASFAQESTRYVAYDQDRHGGQIEVINPPIDPNDIENYNAWHYGCLMCETQYMNMRRNGIQAQIARGVLPLDLKTEIVVTATEIEWQHIINLRMHGTTGAPHPQIKQLMELAYPLLVEESGGRIQ